MRTLILATAAAFGIAIARAGSGPAVDLASRCNLRSRCRRKRTKALRRATPEKPDSWGNRRVRVLPRIRPDVPIRAVRPRPVRAAAKVLKLAALHASC